MEEGLNWNMEPTMKNTNKTIGLNLFCRGGDAQLSEHIQMREQFFGMNFQKNFFGDEQYWTCLSSPARLWHQPRMFNRYEKSNSDRLEIKINFSNFSYLFLNFF